MIVDVVMQNFTKHKFMNIPFHNQKIDLVKRLTAILAFVLYLNIFFFKPIGGFGIFLIGLGLVVFILSIFIDKESIYKNYVSLISIVMFGLLMLLNILRLDNSFVLGLSFLAFMFAMVVLAYISSAKIPFFRSFSELLFSPFRSFGTYWGSFPKSIKSLANIKYEHKTVEFQHRKFDMAVVRSIIIGLIISAPIVMILLFLFAQADPIFADFIKHLNLDFEFNFTVPRRIIWSAVVFTILFPFLAYKLKADVASPLKDLKRNAFVHEYSVIMILVAAVFALFLIVQWPYVFAKVAFETDMSKFGVATYSEYVRKGFGELLFIAVLMYSLLWAGLIILKNKFEHQKSILKPMQMIVLVEFAIFILSIFRRIGLYVDSHGWSLVRLYGMFLLLWVGMMTLTLTLRHFYHKHFVILEATITAGLLLFIGFFNAEGFIARFNPPTVNNRIDYVYLSRMSADGYYGWIEAYEFAEDVLTKNDPDSKKILDKDDRRDIAYAGMVLDRLTKIHFELISKFDNENDIHDYYEKIIENEIAITEDKLNSVDADYPDFSGLNVTSAFLNKSEVKQAISFAKKKLASGTTVKELELIFKNGGWVDDDYKTVILQALSDTDSSSAEIVSLRASKLKMEKALERFTRGDEKSVEIQITNWYRNGVDYANKLTDQSFYHIYDAVSEMNRNYYKKGVLKVNISEYFAYQRIQKDIPLNDLLDLQMKFQKLLKKVRNQNPVDQWYEKDISMDAPFLEW